MQRRARKWQPIAGIAFASLVAGNAYGYGVGGGRMARPTRVPTVRIGRATVIGSISQEVIRRVTRRNINQLRFCYEQTLAATPDAAGDITLRYVIGPQGTVQTAVVMSTSVADPRVPACFVNAVRRWQFPSPDGGGVVTVVAPFALTMAQ